MINSSSSSPHNRSALHQSLHRPNASFSSTEDLGTINYFEMITGMPAAAIYSRTFTKPPVLATTIMPSASTKDGTMSEEEFFASLPVFDMFPLSNGDDNHVVLYALLYAVLFLVGVCGNVSVITLIRHVHSNIPYDNTMVYVLFLCCVDLASVVPLPMAIVDQLLGFWMFGTWLCKLYRILEHVGRCLSTFVLAAMAFDRFLRVCYPHKKTTRSIVVLQLVLLSTLTFILLSPLLIKASSEEIVLKEVLLENPYRLARVRIYKCMDHLEGLPLSIFIMYMFFIGFFVPVILITVFYALMVRKLFMRSRSVPTSQLPVNRIAIYTIAISVFFVICWSPYWIAMLYLNLYRSTDDDSEDSYSSEKFIYIMYGIHALPYVNSASNWLLYGLLNSQLMRRANTKKDLMMGNGPVEREPSTRSFQTTNASGYNYTALASNMNGSSVKENGECEGFSLISDDLAKIHNDYSPDSIIVPRPTDSLL
ncbi:7 transmembrane receptor (rhodopsin family) domain-containing protein [Ditylenchus destructor]|nr:7 transmembrane receptor (rhodopsin family) domain-containing protein [Ditylenchus destructor]